MRDGSRELMSVHIRGAIDALLHAYAQANMYRTNGHPGYVEGIPANLDAAMGCVEDAMSDAKEQIKISGGVPRNPT